MRSATLTAVRRLLIALTLTGALAAAPAAAQETPGTGLSVGITEFNPGFLWPAADRPTLPEPFGHWRDELATMKPAFVRLVLDWHNLQHDPAQPANLDIPQTGCVRNVPPCLSWSGVREQLQAIGALQRARPTTQAMVVITGTPEWAASDPSGCERAGTGPRSRAPRDDALPAYRRLALDVLEAAQEQGAELQWWSAWNEPNHPLFLSPQRNECDVNSPTVATGPYVKLVTALEEALTEAPGEQRQMIGELAGSIGGSKYTTSIGQFVAALPNDILCAALVWALHGYVSKNDNVGASVKALDARACAREHAIWLTETGLGGAKAGPPDGTPVPQEREDACQRIDAWLRTMHAHPRVTVAIQYTLREDLFFRTGLLPTELDRAYPTLRAWQAWGAATAEDPSAAPTEAQACGT